MGKVLLFNTETISLATDINFHHIEKTIMPCFNLHDCNKFMRESLTFYL